MIAQKCQPGLVKHPSLQNKNGTGPLVKKEETAQTERMAKGGLKIPKSNAAMIATGIAVVVLIFIVYASFFMVPASSDHRVLLVASDVLAQAGGPAKFATYLSNQSVAVVPYNYDRVAKYEELGDLVAAHMASTGATRVRSVGIVYHTPNRYNLQCFASDPEKSTVSGSPGTFESFRRFVVALRAAYGVEDVDLISCDVVSAETSVLSALDYSGARVNASTNTTGQVKQGPVGDWVLEAGNVNLIGRYFSASITQADLALTAAEERAKIAIIYLQIQVGFQVNAAGASWKIYLTGMTANQWPKNRAELITAIKTAAAASHERTSVIIKTGIPGQKAYAGFLRGVNQLRVPFGKMPLTEITDHPSWSSSIQYPLTFMDSNSLTPSIHTITYQVARNQAVPNYEDMRAETPVSISLANYKLQNEIHSQGATLGYKLSNPDLNQDYRDLNLYNMFGAEYTLAGPTPSPSWYTPSSYTSKVRVPGAGTVVQPRRDVRL